MMSLYSFSWVVVRFRNPVPSVRSTVWNPAVRNQFLRFVLSVVPMLSWDTMRVFSFWRFARRLAVKESGSTPSLTLPPGVSPVTGPPGVAGGVMVPPVVARVGQGFSLIFPSMEE